MLAVALLPDKLANGNKNLQNAAYFMGTKAQLVVLAAAPIPITI